MHERIKELSLQAQKYAGQQIDEGADWDDAPIYYTEKFAELIVQECMACSTWVGKNNTNSVEPVHTAHAINQRIKQQFGVEE
jgi:hypothetical protein